MNKQITEIIVEAIEELNTTLETKVNITASETTILNGNNSVLDSIALVSLVMIVEGKIKDKLGVDIILVNEGSMSKIDGPFSTISTLSNYIGTLV